MGVTAPTAGNFSHIPNGDSQAFEFNDARPVRSPTAFPASTWSIPGRASITGCAAAFTRITAPRCDSWSARAMPFRSDPEFLPGSGLTNQLVGCRRAGHPDAVRGAQPDLSLPPRRKRLWQCGCRRFAAQLGPPQHQSSPELHAARRRSRRFPNRSSARKVGVTLSFGIDRLLVSSISRKSATSATTSTSWRAPA